VLELHYAIFHPAFGLFAATDIDWNRPGCKNMLRFPTRQEAEEFRKEYIGEKEAHVRHFIERK
jgi:hypothetical protein